MAPVPLPEPDPFRPDSLICLDAGQAEARLRALAPGLHPLLRNLTARILTDARASSDAALILADYLREITEAAEDGADRFFGLNFLIGILIECAPFLRCGARHARP